MEAPWASPETAKFWGRWFLFTLYVCANSAAVLYLLSILLRPTVQLGERILYALLFIAVVSAGNAFAFSLFIK